MTNEFKVVISTPGRFHLFKVAYELEKRGLLEQIYSTYPKFKIFPREKISKEKVTSFPVGELFFRVGLKVNLNKYPSIISRIEKFKSDLFDYQVSNRLKIYSSDIIFHGQSSVQVQSFKVAQKKGIKTVLERASSHVLFQNEILREEYEKHGIKHDKYQPDWFVKKELEEYELADKILVPSEFSKSTFIDMGVNTDKVMAIPLGANINIGTYNDKNEERESNLLKLLFVGHISFRKGIPYLLEAVKNLLDRQYKIELTLVGSIEHSIKPLLKKYNKYYIYKGVVSHTKLAQIYSTHDIFVFPSLEDGFAMVVLEAMTFGMVVISSVHTGASDCITEGVNGFVIPIRSSNKIVNKVKLLYDDKKRLIDMGNNAKERALKQSWTKYAEALTSFYKRM